MHGSRDSGSAVQANSSQLAVLSDGGAANTCNARQHSAREGGRKRSTYAKQCRAPRYDTTDFLLWLGASAFSSRSDQGSDASSRGQVLHFAGPWEAEEEPLVLDAAIAAKVPVRRGLRSDCRGGLKS